MPNPNDDALLTEPEPQDEPDQQQIDLAIADQEWREELINRGVFYPVSTC